MRVEVISYIRYRGGVPVDLPLSVIADQDTPYGLLRALLDQADAVGFTDFRMVVRAQ
jgi:hypothetical protein